MTTEPTQQPSDLDLTTTRYLVQAALECDGLDHADATAEFVQHVNDHGINSLVYVVRELDDEQGDTIRIVRQGDILLPTDSLDGDSTDPHGL